MAKGLTFTLAAAATLLMVSTASATEGYFAHGYGARQSAMAGAGVADATDAMALSINPAGITSGGDQFSLGATVFSPRRGFTVSPGGGFLPVGETESDSDYFVIPNVGLVRQIDSRSAVSIAAYGNGGMNTDYGNVSRSFPECGGGSGIFCGGGAGVDLSQLFITVGYARRLTDNFSVGIAPIFAYQMFEARGLGAFAGASVSPSNMTDNGVDTSSGFGVRVGADLELGQHFSLGGSYQSSISMSEMSDYSGLFEGRGSFDIPSNYQVGIAVEPMDGLTLVADYRHINYSEVAAVGNSTTKTTLFGSSGGPGFGWDDVDAFKVGAEYDATDQLVLRLGVGYNENPIGSEDVTLNVLAPGVMEQHFTGGFTYQASDSNALDFAVMFAPESTVSGPEMTPVGATGRRVELDMTQFAVTIGWTHTLGQ